MQPAFDYYRYRLESTDPAHTLLLPRDLKWEDEFSWNPVAQVYEYSTEGNLLVQESTKKAGKHITLVGLDDMAWVTRAEMRVLLAMRDTPGLRMQLSFYDTVGTGTPLFSHKVRFRHMDGAVEYSLIKQWDQYEEDAYHIINAIRLMIVP